MIYTECSNHQFYSNRRKLWHFSNFLIVVYRVSQKLITLEIEKMKNKIMLLWNHKLLCNYVWNYRLFWNSPKTGYEWVQRTKLLLAVIYGSRQWHSQARKPIQKIRKNVNTFWWPFKDMLNHLKRWTGPTVTLFDGLYIRN